MDDLLLSMRQKSIHDIREIEYAFLEPNGKLSIFQYKPFRLRSSYPMPLILDGEINKKTLQFIKKDKNWLLKELAQKRIMVANVFYAFYKNKKIYIIKKSEV